MYTTKMTLTTYLFIMLTFVTQLVLNHAKPSKSDNVGAFDRGLKFLEKVKSAEAKRLMYVPEELRRLLTTTTPPNPHVPVKRKSRGEIISAKFSDIAEAFKTTTTTTTAKPTTTTTTKSPEQIAFEERAKSFEEKIKRFQEKLAGGLENEKSNGNEAKEESVDEQVKEMDKKTHEMLDGCDTNEDCVESTCCFKHDPAKRGKCMAKPHRLDQNCSDMCGCQGNVDGRDLVCSNPAVTISLDDTIPVSVTRQCKIKEYSDEEILQRMSMGRLGGRMGRIGGTGFQPKKQIAGVQQKKTKTVLKAMGRQRKRVTFS